MAIDLHEYKKLYLQTSQELLKTIQNGVATLKNNPQEQSVLADIHRAAHSLKSQSLVMGYTQLGLAGRILEVLFMNVKEQKIVLNEELVRMIDDLLTAMGQSLQDIHDGHRELNVSSYISDIEKNTEIRLLA